MHTLVVVSAHRFVFTHNPKAAGTAFRRAIVPLHDHSAEFSGITWNAYFQALVDLAHLQA